MVYEPFLKDDGLLFTECLSLFIRFTLVFLILSQMGRTLDLFLGIFELSLAMARVIPVLKILFAATYKVIVKIS